MEHNSFPWEAPTPEELGVALMEVLIGQPIDTCPQREHGWVRVVSEGCTPGFTGARIWFINFSCGCQWVDATADDADAAR